MLVQVCAQVVRELLLLDEEGVRQLLLLPQQAVEQRLQLRRRRIVRQVQLRACGGRMDESQHGTTLGLPHCAQAVSASIGQWYL